MIVDAIGTRIVAGTARPPARQVVVRRAEPFHNGIPDAFAGSVEPWLLSSRSRAPMKRCGTTTALDGLDLEVEQTGEVHGFLG